MSANIYWRPMPKGVEVETSTASAFIHALKLPRQFSIEDCTFLDGVKAGNNSWSYAIDKIVMAVIEHGVVEVFYEA